MRSRLLGEGGHMAPGLSRLWSSMSWPTRQLAILQPKVPHEPLLIPGPHMAVEGGW